MRSLKNQLVELVQFTELYLLDEYKKGDKIVASFENYSYFKQHFTPQKKPIQAIQHPKESQSLPQSKEIPEPTALKTEPMQQAAKRDVSEEIPESTALKTQPMQPAAKRDFSKEIPEPTALKTEPMQPAAKRDFLEIPEPTALKTEPMQPAAKRDFSELQKILQDQGVKITDTPQPSPKPSEVVIFYTTRMPAEIELLQQLIKAIQQHFGPASLIEALAIESHRKWKLILATQKDLNAMPELQSLVKNMPLLVMPEPNEMLRDPNAKRSLWNSLKSYFKT